MSDMTDSEIRARLTPYLQAGERLVWSGRPSGGLVLGPRDIFLIPFSLLWAGVVVFLLGTVLFSGAPGVFFPVGLIFLTAGCYVVFGRFIIDAWARRRTVYGLTDRRAIVVRRVFSEAVLSEPLDGRLRMNRGGSGRGTISFGAPVTAFGFGRNPGLGFWHAGLSSEVVFLGIERPEQVYALASRA
jgi:hypothetical protein